METDIAIFFLMTLGLFLMLVEIVVYTFGIFAAIGAMLYMLGLFALFWDGVLSLQSGYFLMLLLMGIVVMLVVSIRLGFKAYHAPVVTGVEGLLGETGEVVSMDRKGHGWVRIHGELWEARSQDSLNAGDEVIVTKMHNLILTLKKKER